MGVYVYDITPWARCNGMLCDPRGTPVRAIHTLLRFTFAAGQAHASPPPWGAPLRERAANCLRARTATLRGPRAQVPTNKHYVLFRLDPAGKKKSESQSSGSGAPRGRSAPSLGLPCRRTFRAPRGERAIPSVSCACAGFNTFKGKGNDSHKQKQKQGGGKKKGGRRK